jgi:hypothetical protein
VTCKLPTTAQNINSHWVAKHSVKGQCLECETDIFSSNKFCSKSCSAKYNNEKRAKKLYTCKNCNKLSTWSHQKDNIYCSLKCSSEARLSKTLDRFYLGEITERVTIRKVLSKIRGYNCECCGLSDWQGKEITLQVDHIDGNAGNNIPDNLRLICPNCHSQTESFGGGNKGNGRAFRGLPLN